jgi:hypothetical protein
LHGFNATDIDHKGFMHPHKLMGWQSVQNVLEAHEGKNGFVGADHMDL